MRIHTHFIYRDKRHQNQANALEPLAASDSELGPVALQPFPGTTSQALNAALSEESSTEEREIGTEDRKKQLSFQDPSPSCTPRMMVALQGCGVI